MSNWQKLVSTFPKFRRVSQELVKRIRKFVRNIFFKICTLYRNVSVDLLKRAERAGFEAIVVTLDAQTFGNKRKTARTGFYLPSHIK